MRVAQPDLDEKDINILKIIYLLFLGGIFGGFTVFPAIVMVYVFRWKAPDWLYTHYILLEHSFWKGLVIFTLGAILKPIFIGYLIWLYLIVWWILRCLKGLRALAARQEIDNAFSWGWRV